MRVAVAIGLLGLYLFSNTELSQLLKLSVLIEHFEEHKAKNQGISFLDYLHHHYIDSHADDGDGERDQQLPFQSHNDCLAFNLAFYPTDISYSLIPDPVFAEKTDSCFPYHLSLSGKPLSAVWQPPKRIDAA